MTVCSSESEFRGFADFQDLASHSRGNNAVRGCLAIAFAFDSSPISKGERRCCASLGGLCGVCVYEKVGFECKRE